MNGKEIPPPPEGTINQDDFNAYMKVIVDALQVHYDRERVRQGLWKDYEAKDQVNSIKIKVDRVIRSIELGIEGREKNIEEELLDVINYAVFAIRQL